MEKKKTPQRMCIACRASKDKKDLIRIVKTESDFILDKTGKLNGRGSYVCNNHECIEKVIKNRILNKIFKTNIDQDVYDNLRENFFGNK